MNILITGIHGFVGSNFVAAFKDKLTIYGLDIISPAKDGVVKTFSWHELNDIPNVDVVIHLAGKAHDTKNKTDSKSYFDINLGLTIQIYDWFLQSSAKKFIFFSSVKAVADSVKGDFLTEDVTPEPLGAYGESKLAAENYIQSLEKSKKDSTKTYILRPCMIHGPGNKGNLNILFNYVKIGFPWILSSFNNFRSFTSIDNLVFIIDNLIHQDVPEGIYNISDDEPISTNELVETIGGVLQKNIRKIYIKKNMIIYTAKICDFLRLPFNSNQLHKLTETYIVSNEKIKNNLNINKLPISAREGITLTLNNFKT